MSLTFYKQCKPIEIQTSESEIETATPQVFDLIEDSCVVEHMYDIQLSFMLPPKLYSESHSLVNCLLTQGNGA